MSASPDVLYANYPGRRRTLADDSERSQDTDMSERVAKLEATIDTIRAEIRASAAETRAAVSEGVSQMRASNAESKAEIASLRAEIAETASAQIKWYIGTAIALAAIILAAARFVH